MNASASTRTRLRTLSYAVITCITLMITGACGLHTPDSPDRPGTYGPSSDTLSDTGNGTSEASTKTTSPSDSSTTAPHDLLGMPLHDPVAVEFLTGHGCWVFEWILRCPIGVDFSLDGNIIDTVIYDAPGRGEPSSAGYEGQLPGGITFTDSPETLRRKLGEPVAGTPSPNSFLKWTDGEYVLFLSYLPGAPLAIRHVQLSHA